LSFRLLSKNEELEHKFVCGSVWARNMVSAMKERK
jgi:hypothetical protein